MISFLFRIKKFDTLMVKVYLKTVILSVAFVFMSESSILITYRPFVSITCFKFLQTECQKETTGNK